MTDQLLNSLAEQQPVPPTELVCRQIGGAQVDRAVYEITVSGTPVGAWWCAAMQSARATFALRGATSRDADVLVVDIPVNLRAPRWVSAVIMNGSGQPVGGIVPEPHLRGPRILLRDAGDRELGALVVRRKRAVFGNGAAMISEGAASTGPGRVPSDLRHVWIQRQLEWPTGALVVTAGFVWAVWRGRVGRTPGSKVQRQIDVSGLGNLGT